MRPYKEAISTEQREKLIVGATAGVTGIYRYFQAQRLVEKQPFDDGLRSSGRIGAERVPRNLTRRIGDSVLVSREQPTEMFGAP